VVAASEAGGYRDSHLEKGKDYHDKFSQQPYLSMIWRLESETLTEWVKDLPRPSDVRYLDFACGTGRVIGTVEPLVGRAVGVDISASMLDVARQHLQHAELVCSDITRSHDLDGRGFDLITSFRFFPNAEPALRDEAMKALVRLLAPGGRMIVNNHRRRGNLRWVLRSVLNLFRSRKKDLHTMSDTEMEDLAARHGLVVTRVRFFGIWPVLKESKPFLSIPRLERFERWATKRAFLGRIASHKIYVLERR
jgi:SAM-dependent methyltransferase